MFTELQFLAVGAFLLWGLASALCDMLLPESPRDSSALAVAAPQSDDEPELRTTGDHVWN